MRKRAAKQKVKRVSAWGGSNRRESKHSTAYLPACGCVCVCAIITLSCTLKTERLWPAVSFSLINLLCTFLKCEEKEEQ